MANEKIYDAIFDKVFQDAEQKLGQVVFYKANEEDNNLMNRLSFNDYMDDLIHQYRDKGMFNANDLTTRTALNTAYSSIRALRTVCNLTAAQQIKNSLNDLFRDTPANNQWFEENGLGKVNKEELHQLMSNYVDQKLEDIYKSQGLNDLPDDLKHQCEKMKPSQALQECFDYVYTVNKQLLNGVAPEDAISPRTPDPDTRRKVFSEHFVTEMADVIDNYSKTINNAVPKDRNWFELTTDSFADGMNVNINFHKDNTVNPHEFLKRYNENALTDADKEWADNIFRSIQDGHKGLPIDFQDFYANGEPLITMQDYAKLEQGQTTVEDLNRKIVASMLSGDQVSFQPVGAEKPVYVNPSIHNASEKAGFFESIWEWFLSLFNKTTDRQKINEQINEMNEKFEKNNTAERTKMSFDALVDNHGVTDKRTVWNNNQVTNERTNEIPAPTIKP